MIFALLRADKAAAQELRKDLRLAAPAGLSESGFLKHILPRFKLKHRITVVPVAPDAEAEFKLEAGGANEIGNRGAARVFAPASGTGAAFGLTLLAPGPETEKFRDWILSDSGKSAIESFPRGGPAAYTTAFEEVIEEEVIEITGDAELGARLALVHCGRCHVVDDRNRMGGIGSSPSFGAMRARPHWFELFSAYYVANPHPSFTEVIDVTEPFDAQNLSHIVPVRITLEEIDAIIAFVEAMPPKDLGKPVASQ